MERRRLTTWDEWYDFATMTLELRHAEAVAYANARYVEEQNRQALGARRAA